MFECPGPLGLLLKKSSGTLCLADIPTYVELAKSKLILRNEECKWLTLKKFTELKNLAEKEIVSLPVSARICHTDQFNLESFMNATFHQFVDVFIEEINKVFEQLQFWINFTILTQENFQIQKGN